MKLTHLLALTQLALALDFPLFDTVRNAPHSAQIVTKRGIAADIDVPESNSVPVEDLTVTDSLVQSPSAVYTKDSDIDDDDDDEDDKEGRFSSNPFLMSISMIIVSEIGDKTFLISALMAMRHSRVLVFSASFASLAIMTVLSGIVGHTLPTLLSQRVTQFMAAILFVIFGVKLTREGLAMSSDLGVDEELAEVEEELTVTDMNLEMNDLESGAPRSNSPQQRGLSSTKTQIVNSLLAFLTHVKTISALVLSPLWVQVFVMIFLGEWGDRSQIATIAMAAGSNYWAVIMGAVIGHGLCTLAAVVGGKMLASRISMRSVTLGGAFAFFVFAILYFIDAMSNDE